MHLKKKHLWESGVSTDGMKAMELKVCGYMQMKEFMSIQRFLVLFAM